VKSRLRAGISFLVFLLFIGIASTHGSRILDSSMAIFVLAVYVFGSAVLVMRALASKPGIGGGYFPAPHSTCCPRAGDNGCWMKKNGQLVNSLHAGQ